jgi:hypothetical protein
MGSVEIESLTGKQAFEMLDLQDQAEADLEYENLRATCESVVKKFYNKWITKLKSPRVTALAIYYKFGKLWARATIRKYIPDEAKDEDMQDLAIRGNRLRREERAKQVEDSKSKSKVKGMTEDGETVDVWLKPKTAFWSLLKRSLDLKEPICISVSYNGAIENIRTKSDIQQEEE